VEKSPAPRLLECERAVQQKLELEHFLNQHGIDICLLNKTVLNPGQAFKFASYVCLRKKNSWGQYSHSGLPWNSPPLSTRSGPDPIGGNCHSIMLAGRQVKNPCCLPFALPPTDQIGPVRLFPRWVASPVGQ